MSLLVIAYPTLSPDDTNRIQNFRALHDRLYYDVVPPHFTLVFPVSNWSQEKFIREIKSRAFVVQTFSFVLRCATVNKDSFSPHYHTFLVPDEGYSHFVKLHDLLYSGLLSNDLRLDIDYIPHIGVGNDTDPQTCKRLANDWNASGFGIRGEINSLTVVNYEHNKVSPLEVILLR